MTGAVSLPGEDQRKEPLQAAPAPHAIRAGVQGTHRVARAANSRAMAQGACHQRRRTRKNTELSSPASSAGRKIQRMWVYSSASANRG